MTVMEPAVGSNVSPQFTRLIDSLRRRGVADHVSMVTTSPGGGLRVCRSTYLTQHQIAQYAELNHQNDSAAWNAILKGHTTSGTSPLAERMNFVIGVGVDHLVVPGFAGAVLLFKTPNSDKTAFNEVDEAQSIRQLVQQHLGIQPSGAKVASQVILSESRSATLPAGKESPLDELMIKNLFEQIAGKSQPLVAERFSVKGNKGILTNLSVTRFDQYRALGGGPKLFVSLYPTLAQWQQASADRVEGDIEMARLIKAVHFMAEHFRTSPTLESIADSVGLSQFHFHRRFSEVFGVTPKHVLFDLQVEESKRQLAIDGRQLSEIASNCGFAHQSHFTCRFKQNTGITPTRWRVLHTVG